MLLEKTKSSTIKVLISEALTNFNYDKFVLVNNGLREHNEIKDKIKNLENVVVYIKKSK